MPKKIRDELSANIPPEIDAAIKAFLQSRAAKKLGIKSKDEFVRRACVAVLSKYRDDYQALTRLFEIADEDMKRANQQRAG